MPNNLTAKYISKVELPNGGQYLLKDAAAWEVLTSFFGDPVVGQDGAYHFPEFQESSEGTIQEIIQEIINNQYITEINEAATYDVSETIDSSSTHGTLPTSKAVYDYVDSMIETIPEFDVVVVSGNLPTASADTFHKIYLQDASSPAQPNLYKEWITLRTGTDPNYSYSWELIGDTSMSLDGYAQEAWVKSEIQKIEIAGVTVTLNQTQQGDTVSYSISAADLKDALSLGDLAYKDSASGSTVDQTFTGLKATGTLEATVTGATLSHTDTNAVITSSNTYTPAGNVSVSLTTATAGISAEGNYTPTGSVVAEAGSSTNVLATASFAKDNAGVEIEGTNEASAVTFDNTGSTVSVVTGLTAGTAASLTTTYTPASLGSGFFNAGTAATFTEGAFTAATITYSTATVSWTNVALAATPVDNETLIFATPTITQASDISAFNGGSKVADTFNAGSLPSIDDTAFNGGSFTATFTPNSPTTAAGTDSAIKTLGAATAAAQVFHGDKYKVNTTTETVLDSGASFTFSGNQATITVAGQYEKATGATGSFTATNSADIPATIQYKKAEMGSVSVTIANPELTVETFTVTAQTVTVS